MYLQTIYQLGDFFYKKVACDHAGNDKAESALSKFISLLCKNIYIP